MLSNDSASIRKDQSYEIALTEYRGKVYGYTRSEFIVNDTLYYIVKRVKGVINGDTCEVIDEKILSYNFRGRIDKGVKLINTFRLNKENNTWQLDGKWKTNTTKKYYALTGKTELTNEKDLSKSKLFPHLEELNLADDVAFYKEKKEEDEKNKQAVVIKKATPVQPINQPAPEKEIIKKEPPPLIIAPSPVLDNKTTAPLVTEKKSTDKIIPVTKAITETTRLPEKKQNNPAVVMNQPKQEISKPEVIIKKDPPIKDVVKTPVVTITPEPKILATQNNELKNISPEATALMQERKPVFAEPLIFRSDSLQLALYDNGEIDGDTVSIFMNNELLLVKQGLKASAIRKTIYMTPDMDSIVLVLYAENLGKYPPNTGLLVVRDGEDIYNVRFSADLKKNAAIVFRRKKQ